MRLRLIPAVVFRKRMGELLRDRDPILLLKHTEVVGLVFPQPAKSLPERIRRKVQGVLSAIGAYRLENVDLSKARIKSQLKGLRKPRSPSSQSRRHPERMASTV